jgi:hypothetical protein
MVENLGSIAVVTLRNEDGRWAEVYAVYPDVHGELQCQMLFGMS